MRIYFLIFLVMCLITITSFQRGREYQKHKNFKAERYSAEWGCLAATMRACGMMEREDKKYPCMDYMREDFCPKAADGFEKFMSQSSH